MRQYHAGQLRYHDFTKLREARNSRNSTFPMKTLTSFPSSSLINAHNCILTTVPTQMLLSAENSRSFFTMPLTDRLAKFRLKQLERNANSNPSNPAKQYEFLSELIKSYPEAVIHRFNTFPEFAIDDRCSMLYFTALQRSGGNDGKNAMDKFSLSTFVKRIKSNSSVIDPLKIQTLIDLESNKKGKKSRATLATEAMKILSGSSSAGAGGIGGASIGAVGAFAPLGVDPKNPLHVQMNNPTSGRAAVLNLVKGVAIAFICVSAATALLEGSGLGGRGLGGIGGSKHIQEAQGSDITFDDVMGVEEAKAELEEIVEYLKNPEKFTRLGGKLPRGLLLTGPPGTGKTLLAKAIAGEASVPFFFSSGSQFEEVYVGLGAKRVRELFETAKKKAPAIIFIDEIDAVGGNRKLKDQSALKMTLNELLVQMDGFDDNNGIIVIGATNFASSLDKALLRPGRFDKHVSVPLPDVGGRKDILEMYAKKTKISKDVDLNVLARGTVGFSGADLNNLMNQAALKASIDGLNSITMQVLEYAKDKILMGAERKTAVITPKTARCTAYHEAGHALVAVLSEGAVPIHKATIMPRGSALGMVTMLPEGDQTSSSFKEMRAWMDVAMGGRVAEELIFGPENITSGASNDIQSASSTARAMVTKYGFSDGVGIVHHGGSTGEDSASSETRAKIDLEVKKMTDDAYNRAKDLLTKHSKEHILLAETLLEYETLSGDEVRDIVLRGKKPKRPVTNTNGGARGDQSVLGHSTPKSRKFPGIGGKVAESRRGTTGQK